MANAKTVDLAMIFTAATKTLAKNQNVLNKADTYNHDHGDNVVEVFEVISAAMKAKKGADPADQLEYASQLLRQKTTSGSGQVYARGLERAAQKFSGQSLNTQNIGQLIQSLLGAEQV